MEYLEGKNLLNILSERGPLSLDETLQVVSPIAAALTYAHGKGVYHRDIKPANIMVFPDGRSVITDFGLAHLESTSMTTAGQFLGSPSYMSPEQIMGHEMTPQSDVFSLSVVTYEMLTGQKPFPGENITTVVYKVVHSPPVPPHEHNPVLPADYKEIFECALAKNPSARFASFAELVAALNLKEFDRLELPVATPTDTEETLAARAPDVPTGHPDAQETAGLPTPVVAAESTASITERKRDSAKRWLKPPAALAVVAALALMVWLSYLLGRPPTYDLRVESDPEGAEVWLDGEIVGASPVDLPSLRKGEHLLRVTKDGFLEHEETIELTGEGPGEPILFALQPENVTLFLESVPEGASVTIDGEPAGHTPLKDVEVEPGQHEVQVSRAGYETWRSVVVARAGETVDLVARLRATPPAPRKTNTGGLVELGPEDKPAKRISGTAPSYPPMARKLKQQGRVTVEFTLTEAGVPTEIQVLESGGPILDKAVLESIAEWRYEPAERNGVPVRVKMRARQTFRLGSR